MSIATATAPDTGWQDALPEYAGVPFDQMQVKAHLGSAARHEVEQVREPTAELVATQEKALQVERLAAIGQTVTAPAHEGRNALQRVAACLPLLEIRQEAVLTSWP